MPDRCRDTRAQELGINLLDTSDMYGPHTNEQLVGESLSVMTLQPCDRIYPAKPETTHAPSHGNFILTDK